MRVVLVVDDGSRDATAASAKAAGALVLQLPSNAGKGAALEAGCALLDSSPDALGWSDCDVLLLLDGDLEASASQAGGLLFALKDCDADLAIASLPTPTKSGGFGFVKRLASKAIVREANKTQCVSNFPLAPLSGQRAIRFETLSDLRPFAAGYGVETIMTLRALRAGLRVIEVPVAITHAATGRNLAGFLHRAHQYLDIRRALRKYRFENSHVELSR